MYKIKTGKFKKKTPFFAFIQKTKDQRRKWFESLSPEAKKAFIQKKMLEKSNRPERLAVANSPEVLADKRIIEQWREEDELETCHNAAEIFLDILAGDVVY